MTSSPSPTIFLQDIDSIETGHEHISCCIAEPKKFVCGAPFHPECDKKDDAKRETSCRECDKIMENMRCPAGHQHCPCFRPPRPVCPPKKGSS